MAGVAEDADLGRSAACLPQDRAGVVVGVMEGESFPGKVRRAAGGMCWRSW